MTPRHAAEKKSRKKLFLSLGLVAVLAGMAAGIVLLVKSSPTAHTVSPAKSSGLSVIATSPTNNATVDATVSIRVALSSDLSPSSPLPTLSPSIPGTWERLSGSVLEFVQQAPFQPGQAVTITVPSNLTATSGARLTSAVTTSFQVGTMSITRIQQLLAEEGYLPVTFIPSMTTSSAQIQTGDEIGTFAWRWNTLPTSLTSQWAPGQDNVVTRGAIMRFQDVHHMTTTGTITPAFEAALLADRQSGTMDPDPYTYVDVFKSLPQHLNLYSNGQVVYTTLVNTGIPGQDTASGTYPVYLRYTSTTMSGTNPDGSTYHDVGIPWVSYFHGGDALHGYIRPSYGFPQSLGCVEMPYANAGIVWPQTPIGTLVSVN